MNVHDLSVVHERVEAGESLTAVARELGVKPNTLYAQYRRVYGPIGFRAPGGGKKVVTEEILDEAEERVHRGESLYAIAHEKGINRITLQRAYEKSGRKNPNPPGQRPGNRTHRASRGVDAMRDWKHDPKGHDAVAWIIATLAAVDGGMTVEEIRQHDGPRKRRDLR